MDVFGLRQQLIKDYEEYVRSFIYVKDQRIDETVDHALNAGLLWPDPLIQLNPSFAPGGSIDQLVDDGVLHEGCRNIFRVGKDQGSTGKQLKLHKHQDDAIRAARTGRNYILTTGTGSGKSLSYIIPIVDAVLRAGPGKGIFAIIVYPMNALANSQANELEKFLGKNGPVRFARYTGQEDEATRAEIWKNPPDILLTNFMMMELMLTRPDEEKLIDAAQGLRFLVLDELHTYRGRQGADVAMLVRRARDRLTANKLQCVGTSATLASGNTRLEQKTAVAAIATTIFGKPVLPEDVIGETLQRATVLIDPEQQAVVEALRKRIGTAPPTTWDHFIRDPLASWIEDTFGLIEWEGQLKRAKPKPIEGDTGAAKQLAELTGLLQPACAAAIKATLMAGYGCPNPKTGFPTFAFRLHQFLSRGDTVYASLESEKDRYLTVHGQRYVPGDRERFLLPLSFCRECGQEFYVVWRHRDAKTGSEHIRPRDLDERIQDEERDEHAPEAGFVFLSTDSPWPESKDEQFTKLPPDWLEEGKSGLKVKSSRTAFVPQAITANPLGQLGADGIACHFIPQPFRFCPHCGVTYGMRQIKDFGKLAALGNDGRSTATTILGISIVQSLQDMVSQNTLTAKARKLLSFTDNRQDASLQAGHFNDFIEIGLLRSALYNAAKRIGSGGLPFDQLTQLVFNELNLPLRTYARLQDDDEPLPNVRRKIEDALRQIIGYRLYFDLRRGWRVTAPNLEQCGLLDIAYESIDELVREDRYWKGTHIALAGASADKRKEVAITVLDFMRRELCIEVDFLQHEHQERMKQQSFTYLRDPWAIDDKERMEVGKILFPGKGEADDEKGRDTGGRIFVSDRHGLCQNYLSKQDLFKHIDSGRLSSSDAVIVLAQLLKIMAKAEIVREAVPAKSPGDIPGYQVVAGSLRWVAGNGLKAEGDPIRVPRPPKGGHRPNPFFVSFYQTKALANKELEAREHTAQVRNEDRERREQLFREAKLPILFCSPTMELGVDISELNAVNMRNVPPTPANYAQRSGRAGRSGQPALVVTYCAVGSPHDQYFFRKPELMVHGEVTTPRIDITNQDLVTAHIRAIWLAETEADLKSSLKDILDLDGASPSLNVQESLRELLINPAAKTRAKIRSQAVITDIEPALRASGWFTDKSISEILDRAVDVFDRTCDRWRALYRAALKQLNEANGLIARANTAPKDRREAERRHAEARAQLELLRDTGSGSRSDFYSYRYFASEGFLPGYNFPRLPLSAYIPAKRGGQGDDQYLSRARFLALSEFGPQAIVYHEGVKYRINRVILSERKDGIKGVNLTEIKKCPDCGYIHQTTDDQTLNHCPHCEAKLGYAESSLFRMENVATKRRDRINCDEEERQKQGYEIVTGFRFAEPEGQLNRTLATVQDADGAIAALAYGHAAQIWRINLGWKRRKRGETGFLLDQERGYWANKNQLDAKGKGGDGSEDGGSDDIDPISKNIVKVVPYVEDWRNCLLMTPDEELGEAELASLQAALKRAIQVVFQLEDSELAVEPLPTRQKRRHLLFFEAAEGGAGVLRHLAAGDKAQGLLRDIARKALELCHFDPDTGVDRGRAEKATEDCTAGCYDCLLSYGNQLDHELVDRHLICDWLLRLANSTLTPGLLPKPRTDVLTLAQSAATHAVEQQFLTFLDQQRARLPSSTHPPKTAQGLLPDFMCAEQRALIYVDGSDAQRCQRDNDATDLALDAGLVAIRFGAPDTWEATVHRYPQVFALKKSS